MPALDYDRLLADLQAEHDDLVAAMGGISEADWDAPTPAPGWSVRDQVSHLAYFDGVTVTALTDPEGFNAVLKQASAGLGGFVEKVNETGRTKSGAQMLEWFATERAALVDQLGRLDPKAKVPWFGPSMSAASKATARIMETWAHGQDIVDALQLDRRPTDRLEQVCHIGVRALPNSYRAHGKEVPTAPVRVELTGPAGQRWDWGEETASDSVRGEALDFCLVVTQRRHPADTALRIEGRVATEWMSIAQAFAGPPGVGREPGTFPRG